MALPDQSRADEQQVPEAFGLLLIDDHAFQSRVTQILDSFGIRSEAFDAPFESMQNIGLRGHAVLVVIDRLLTRSQRYHAARILRRHFHAPVLVVDTEKPASFDETGGAVQFLQREQVLEEIGRIARFC